MTLITIPLKNVERFRYILKKGDFTFLFLYKYKLINIWQMKFAAS